MRKILDKLFTGTVLIGLISSVWLSYYLRPWRWMVFNPTSPKLPDNPYARIPLPDTGNKSGSEKAEKATV